MGEGIGACCWVREDPCVPPLPWCASCASEGSRQHVSASSLRLPDLQDTLTVFPWVFSGVAHASPIANHPVIFDKPHSAACWMAVMAA